MAKGGVMNRDKYYNDVVMALLGKLEDYKNKIHLVTFHVTSKKGIKRVSYSYTSYPLLFTKLIFKFLDNSSVKPDQNKLSLKKWGKKLVIFDKNLLDCEIEEDVIFYPFGEENIERFIRNSFNDYCRNKDIIQGAHILNDSFSKESPSKKEIRKKK